MATCSSTVYPPAVIASVQQQVREAKVHPHDESNAGGGGSSSGSLRTEKNDGGADDNATCLPDAWRPKPCLMESEFRDSIVRVMTLCVMMCCFYPCCFLPAAQGTL